MQPFDDDDLIHGVIIKRRGLECHQPMEFDYYGAKVVASWFNPKLCAYSAGVSSGVDGIIDERHTLSGEVCFPFAQRVSLIVHVLLSEQGAGKQMPTSGALNVLV